MWLKKSTFSTKHFVNSDQLTVNMFFESTVVLLQRNICYLFPVEQHDNTTKTTISSPVIQNQRLKKKTNLKSMIILTQHNKHNWISISYDQQLS